MNGRWSACWRLTRGRRPSCWWPCGSAFSELLSLPCTCACTYTHWITNQPINQSRSWWCVICQFKETNRRTKSTVIVAKVCSCRNFTSDKSRYFKCYIISRQEIDQSSENRTVNKTGLKREKYFQNSRVYSHMTSRSSNEGPRTLHVAAKSGDTSKQVLLRNEQTYM